MRIAWAEVAVVAGVAGVGALAARRYGALTVALGAGAIYAALDALVFRRPLVDQYQSEILPY